jgi:thiol-disulfide isomerase/thioredoxin
LTARLLVLLVAVGAGVLLLAAFSLYRRIQAPNPEWLDVDELGLELMAGCCAFVIFTTSSCRPCKAALANAEAAAARRPGMTEVATVDAMEDPDLAVRYEVRAIPTTFLITASGHVLGRWTRVPETQQLEEALDGIRAERTDTRGNKPRRAVKRPRRGNERAVSLPRRRG